MPGKSRTPGRQRHSEPVPPIDRTSGDDRWQTLLIAAVAFVGHLAFIWGAAERSSPISAFFFGDSLHFLEAGRHAAQGASWNAGLPFHPPLMGWWTQLFWHVLEQPERVFLATKVSMALVGALTWAIVHRLIRERVRGALWICLLAPLGFGEMLLSASVNSETVYRLLVVAILWNGWRRPWLAGALSGLAALTRAEHLPIVLVVAGALLLMVRERRRFTIVALATMAAVLVPYTLDTHRSLSDYNQRFAHSLPAPLPTWVPVSFYGPLNFALAQREDDIFFARRSLPPAPGSMQALEPNFRPHHEVITNGYRIGLETIMEDPGRFVSRSVAKLRFSLHAATYGFTWRDLPGPPTWHRPPVDLAYSPNGPLHLVIVLGLAGLGAWTMRRQKTFLFVGGTLIVFRLAIGVAFFPYLRSMMIAAPFLSILTITGAITLLGKIPSAERFEKMFPLVVALLLTYHLITVLQPRRFTLDGERSRDGRIIDDRPVTLEYQGMRGSSQSP